MRKVVIPSYLWSKIEELKIYLIEELKLSEIAAEARIKRMENFVMSFAVVADYPLCRFKK